MSSVSGFYAPLPQSISDSDSEKELQMESLSSSKNYTNDGNKSTNYNEDKIYNKHIMHDLPRAKMLKPKMTPVRKMAFAFSIISCFLPIIIFLWVLPCDIETCPVRISNWETRQEGVEMKGTINVFFEKFKKHFNLAVQYVGDMNSPEMLKHGVISFLGNNGDVNWYFRQNVIPDRLDCLLLDVDQDGIADCLLLDEKGFLKIVEVLSGETIWHAHSQEENTLIDNLQFPILLQDLNGDDINELLSIYQKKFFMIICGRTGRALSNFIIKNCNNVDNLKRIRDYLTFKCENTTEATIYIQVKISEISNKFYDVSHAINYVKYNFTPLEIESFILDDYKLDIGNYGNCPNNCRSMMKLSNNNKLIYSKSLNRSYIVKPVKFKFGSNKFKSILLKGHSKGYIVKIWDWHEQFDLRKTTDYPFNFRRNKLNNTDFGNSITERVMLITFNETDYNIIQASSINVTQLCFSTNENKNCQPDIINQDYSLLIYDLDRDGSQELISYSSTFNMREGMKSTVNPWQLVSTIKVLKLESELPKLYDSRETFSIFSNY